MNVFDELSNMQKLIFNNNWGEFEKHYHSLCESYSPDLAKQIASGESQYLTDRIFGSYCKALKKARKNNAKAIYYEYDLDNDWKTAFFVCPEYYPINEKNDDWACHWLSDHIAPGIHDFGKIYAKLGGFCNSDENTAVTLYMIARTTSILNSIIQRKPPQNINICIGFHDQDPIHRIYEYA